MAPAGRDDGKRGQAPVTWGGGCRERWVPSGTVSSDTFSVPRTALQMPYDPLRETG